MGPNRSLYKATASRDSFRTLSSSCDSLLGVTDIVICQFPAKPKLSKISHQIALFVSLASVWVRCGGEILQNCGFRIFLRGEARAHSFWILLICNIIERVATNSARIWQVQSRRHLVRIAPFELLGILARFLFIPSEIQGSSANKPSSSSFCNRIETRL